MKVCSKCKTEKEDDQYYTYWHSSFQKQYTRKVCQECCYRQKNNYRRKLRQEIKKMKEVSTQPEKVAVIAPELQTDVFKDNPLFKFCKACNQYKLLTEYYPNKKINGYATWCKVCHNAHQYKKQREYYDNKFKNNGGSERILATPGKYVDEYQKEQLFWVMELMGWKHNDNGVFSKEGIKDKDKNWPNVKKVPKKKRVYGLRHSRVYDIDKIKELREDGMILSDIAKIMKCSKPTVMKLLKTAYL